MKRCDDKTSLLGKRSVNKTRETKTKENTCHQVKAKGWFWKIHSGTIRTYGLEDQNCCRKTVPTDTIENLFRQKHRLIGALKKRWSTACYSSKSIFISIYSFIISRLNDKLILTNGYRCQRSSLYLYFWHIAINHLPEQKKILHPPVLLLKA